MTDTTPTGRRLTLGLGPISAPVWPHFGEVERIRSIVAEIRTEMEIHLRAGVAVARRLPDAPASARADGDPALPWLLALYAHRYGAIYWVPRHSARTLTAAVIAHEHEVDAIGEYLAATGLGDAVFNVAIASFVRSSRRHSRQADRYVPAGGFQPTGPDAGDLTYRPQDFTDLDLELTEPTARYDLHDFAHLAAARLCPQLYRCPLGPSLDGMPQHLVDLVAGFDSTGPIPPHADGQVFSGILRPLWTSAPWPDLPDAAVVDWLADRVTGYLLAQSTPPGRDVPRPGRPVHPIELAALAQLKAYELPASESEVHLFVRGDLDGDELAELSPAQRLRAIATLTGRLPYEARNTLRHRAHRQAYRTIASLLLRDGDWDPHLRNLLAAVVRHLDFEDYAVGGRQDLIRRAGDLLAWAPGPNTTTAAVA